MSTVTETTFVAKPSVGVNASTERVPHDAVDVPVLAEPGAHVAHETHQPGEGDGDEDQHVLEIAGILPQRTSPVLFAPRKRKTSIAVIRIIANRTEPTWGTESLIRTVASTK